MRPRILRSPSRLLATAIATGFVVTGSAAFAQNHSIAGEHGRIVGLPGGVSSRGFTGSITGFPGQITTVAPHAIAVPGRAVFPAPPHAFVPGFIPQSGPAVQPAWRGNEGWQGQAWRGRSHDRDHDRDRDHRRGGYGFVGGYPIYASSWQLLPYDSGSDFNGDNTDQNQPGQDNAQPAESVPPPSSGFRPEYSGNEAEAWAAQPEYASPSAPAKPIAPEPELTLIFKDGHTQAVRNYVLTASDLVDLDQAATGREKRIPLDELNLPATERAAQQAGLDFSPPA